MTTCPSHCQGLSPSSYAFSSASTSVRPWRYIATGGMYVRAKVDVNDADDGAEGVVVVVAAAAAAVAEAPLDSERLALASPAAAAGWLLLEMEVTM